MSKTSLHYARTWCALAKALGMSERNLYRNWAQRDGHPKDTAKGKCVEHWADFIAGEKRKTLRKQEATQSENADLKRRKLQVEIETLEERLRQLKREAIPIEEHYEEIREYAIIINSKLKLFIQAAEALRSAKLKKEARRIVDEVRAMFVEALTEDA